MRHGTLVMCALLAVATSGCDQFRHQFKTQVTDRFNALVARFRGEEAPARPAPTPAARRDTARGDTARRPRPQASPQAPRVAGPARPLEDVPFVSNDTGTIAPGMTETDIYSLWGPPASVRRAGDWTYLFFRNGCEWSCGTYDVVFLRNGAVVDAIVRWWGHIYDGESSSPPDVVPLPTRTGDPLTMPPPSTQD
jgi:hypothetical protein